MKYSKFFFSNETNKNSFKNLMFDKNDSEKILIKGIKDSIKGMLNINHNEEFNPNLS